MACAHSLAATCERGSLTEIFSGALVGADQPSKPQARAKQPRIELFFKTNTELRERVRLLAAAGFTDFSLVNKREGDPLLEWIDTCLAEVPTSTVCAHYSIKYNRDKGGANQTFRRFSAFLQTLGQCNYGTRAEVLLISGSGPKTPLSAVECLEKLSHNPLHPPLGVAFNPYFENADQAREERRRLVSKIATRQIQTVWLQFGSNTNLLAQSLEWLRTQVDPELQPQRIVGSFFLPSEQLIAQQSSRPWNGVFLSQDYLSGPERAEAISREILCIYHKYGVEVLVEAPGVRSFQDVAALRSLLALPRPPNFEIPHILVDNAPEWDGVGELESARTRGEETKGGRRGGGRGRGGARGGGRGGGRVQGGWAVKC